MGAKKRPFYRIVVADSRTARDGRFIEQIGYFDPTVDPPKVKLDEEKAKLWLGRGAQPTDVVRSIISKVIGAESAEKAEAAPASEEKPKRTRRKKEETEPAAASEEVKASEPEMAAENEENASAEPEAGDAPAEE